MVMAPISRRMRTDANQVIQEARDLVKHHPDVLGAQRHIDTEQLLDREAVGMFVAHHRHVVEPIHIRNGLNPGARLGKLFGSAVEQPDVRIGALDDFAVEFEDQA